MKCSDMRHAIATRPRISGVSRPQTGQSPRTSEKPQVSPSTVIVGMTRGQYTFHSKSMRWTCVEINQCVGCTRQFFTKSCLGDGVAALVPSSGEESASPSHRAGVASMAWRTTL